MPDMKYKEKLEAIREMAVTAFALGASKIIIHCRDEIGSTKDLDYQAPIDSLARFNRVSKRPFTRVTGLSFKTN